MKHIPLFLSLCLIIFSCNKDLLNEEFKTTRETRPESEVLHSGNRFAFSLFKECYDSDTSLNFFISPFSLSIALGMTSNGAAGETQKEINKLLGVDGFSQIDINSDYQKTIELLNAPDSMSSLTIANSIWFPSDFKVKQDFINQNTLNFGAEIFEKDFSSNAIVDTVNSWISDKTKGLIQNALDKKLWSPLVRMYLVNTLYFKGQWIDAFDSTSTVREAFIKTPTELEECTMMHNSTLLSYYYENDAYQMVELPYEGDRYIMNIFLPKNQNISDFISVFDSEEWYSATAKAARCRVDLKLPRFDFETELDLIPSLESLGLTLPFTRNADFSNITEVERLFIGSVKQKTKIICNEVGTEAAAVTVIVNKVISGKDNPVYKDKQMYVNKPFLFTICHNESKSILFVGSVSSPE